MIEYKRWQGTCLERMTWSLLEAADNTSGEETWRASPEPRVLDPMVIERLCVGLGWDNDKLTGLLTGQVDVVSS